MGFVYVWYFTHYMYLSKLDPKRCMHLSLHSLLNTRGREKNDQDFLYFYRVLAPNLHTACHTTEQSRHRSIVPPSNLHAAQGITISGRCLQIVNVSLHSIRFFTSLARQSSRSCTCQSGAGELRVSLVRRTWSLLRDERKDSLIIFFGGTGVEVGSEKTERKRKEDRERRARIWQNKKECKEERSSNHWVKSEGRTSMLAMHTQFVNVCIGSGLQHQRHSWYHWNKMQVKRL